MNQRDRLIELKRKAMNYAQEKADERNGLVCIDDEVDYLLDNGVIVPPCKVKDIVYALWDVPTDQRQIIYCAQITEIRICKRNCRQIVVFIVEPIEYRGRRVEPIEYRGRRREYRLEDFGKTVFLSRGEAEKVLEKNN